MLYKTEPTVLQVSARMVFKNNQQRVERFDINPKLPSFTIKRNTVSALKLAKILRGSKRYSDVKVSAY